MSNPLFDALIHRGEADAPLLFEDGGKPSLSYRSFADRAGQFANALSDLEIKPGDRVAVQVPKSADALALYVACVAGGFVFLPLNTAYTANEISYFVEDAAASVLVCDTGSIDNLRTVAQTAGARLETMGASGQGTLAAAADGQSPRFQPADRDLDDIAAILYTSGTTGRSKGAMLTQRNLLSNARTLVDAWRFTADDVLLHALPIFHTHGLFVASNVMMLAGGAMIFQPSFKVDAVIDALPHATSMMGVPTFYTRLLADDRFNRDLVAHMRLFTSGSAPLLAETHQQFETRTGHRILERYGMTETNMTTSNPYEGERRAGTVGFALPGVEIRICDNASGQPVSPGDIGIIEVRGPNVFKGYWNMPEKTAEEFRQDGFFITGDLAREDEEGYVHIVGRHKDLIISGGYNIYPKEIELVLDDLADVAETAVIGVPHADFGEAVVAVVVPQNPGFSEEGAIAAIDDKLARFKLPKRIVTIDELPRNTMGKVQKNALRDRFKDVLTRPVHL